MMSYWTSARTVDKFHIHSSVFSPLVATSLISLNSPSQTDMLKNMTVGKLKSNYVGRFVEAVEIRINTDFKRLNYSTTLLCGFQIYRSSLAPL